MPAGGVGAGAGVGAAPFGVRSELQDPSDPPSPPPRRHLQAAIVAANELLPYAAANSSSAVAPETLYEAFEHTHETIQHNHGGEPTGTTATVVALNVDKVRARIGG